jgi:hypothetical protein
MKTKQLALAFSLAFLIGNAVNGEQENDPQGPIHTLDTYVVSPHVVKLLNDQKLDPVDFDSIILSDIEEITERDRQIQMITMIAYEMEAILDVPLVASK